MILCHAPKTVWCGGGSLIRPGIISLSQRALHNYNTSKGPVVLQRSPPRHHTESRVRAKPQWDLGTGHKPPRLPLSS